MTRGITVASLWRKATSAPSAVSTGQAAPAASTCLRLWRDTHPPVASKNVFTILSGSEKIVNTF